MLGRDHIYVPHRPLNRIRRKYLTRLADKSLEVHERIRRQLRAETYKRLITTKHTG